MRALNSMKEIEIKSPAKINLGLRVLRKRKDGYHEIETILQMISLYDDILIRESDKEIKVFCDDETLKGRRNLAYTAAKVIKEKSKRKSGVDIFIKKNIPVGSGLGGGSSNAASVILGLNRLWELDYSKERLMEIAKFLGSDVPFFINGPVAIARGRGEIINPIKKVEKMHLILVIPPQPISTEWAYKNLNLKLTSIPSGSTLYRLNLSKINNIQDYLHNDLEEVVKERLPDISEIKKKLISLGSKGVAMSGSGSSVYGIFEEYDMCLKAYEIMKKERWRIIFTETLTDAREFYH